MEGCVQPPLCRRVKSAVSSLQAETRTKIASDSSQVTARSPGNKRISHLFPLITGGAARRPPLRNYSLIPVRWTVQHSVRGTNILENRPIAFEAVITLVVGADLKLNSRGRATGPTCQ